MSFPPTMELFNYLQLFIINVNKNCILKTCFYTLTLKFNKKFFKQVRRNALLCSNSIK